MKPKFIMEKRTADGRLDFSEPRSPFLICTDRQIVAYYFANSGHNQPSATQEEIQQWYKVQGLSWRPKTW